MLRIYLVLAAALICVLSYGQSVEGIDDNITGNLEEHEMIYKHFHQYPELSFKEFKTAERLSAELEKLGFDITRNIGGNGFVGLLKNGPGPVIMIRTDLDALPLQEKTELPFASKVIMTDADGIEMPVNLLCSRPDPCRSRLLRRRGDLSDGE